VYEWRPVDGAEHAFNRFRNPPGSTWLVTLCATETTSYVVRRSEANVRLGMRVAGRCVACAHLAEAGAV
jgi:hypothetical protein